MTKNRGRRGDGCCEEVRTFCNCACGVLVLGMGWQWSPDGRDVTPIAVDARVGCS